MERTVEQRPLTMKDDYAFLVELNQAQLIVLHEASLLDPGQIETIAAGINRLEQAAGGGSGDYLEYEKQLIAEIGPPASNLHLGRSRNDLGATRERLWLRQASLEIFSQLINARNALLKRSAEHVSTVIPAYTHAVQAQPITLAHYLLALDAALSRDSARFQGAYHRINQSPLGAAALATSGFPLDRTRLQELLGFGSLCENSYDCIGVASADIKIELAHTLATSSVAVGRFAQDLVIQQADPTPGITVSDELTGGSSIMPNKRNPSILEKLRATCSRILAEAHAVPTLAHNTPFGDVADVRGEALRKTLDVTGLGNQIYRLLARLLSSLAVDADRCLRQVEQDYATITELADTLFRRANLPFRTGHAVAANLTAYGRSQGKRPKDLTVSEVSHIYRETTGQDLPLDHDAYHHVIDPATFVNTRRGRGGPQPAEVERMLDQHHNDLAALRSWLAAEQTRLHDADAAREHQFQQLLGA